MDTAKKEIEAEPGSIRHDTHRLLLHQFCISSPLLSPGIECDIAAGKDVLAFLRFRLHTITFSRVKASPETESMIQGARLGQELLPSSGSSLKRN
jgi:hypothetical protein